jgi:hypothetical protein
LRERVAQVSERYEILQAPKVDGKFILLESDGLSSKSRWVLQLCFILDPQPDAQRGTNQ